MVTLLIVASTLGRDGTSRFITYLANNLTKSNKVRVKLLFFRNISEDSKSMLDDDVEVSCLEVQGKLWSSFYKILNKLLRLSNVSALLCFHLCGLTVHLPKAVPEHFQIRVFQPYPQIALP